MEIKYNEPIEVSVNGTKFMLSNSGGELMVKSKEGDGLYFTGFRPTSVKIDSDLMTYMRIKSIKHDKIKQKIIDFEESYSGTSLYKSEDDLVSEIR